MALTMQDVYYRGKNVGKERKLQLNAQLESNSH